MSEHPRNLLDEANAEIFRLTRELDEAKTRLEQSQNDAHQQAIKALRLEKQVNELESRLAWRKVSDELPADDVSVLVFDGQHVSKTCRHAGRWLTPALKPEVTHWMPLPAAPNEVGKP